MGTLLRHGRRRMLVLGLALLAPHALASRGAPPRALVVSGPSAVAVDGSIRLTASATGGAFAWTLASSGPASGSPGAPGPASSLADARVRLAPSGPGGSSVRVFGLAESDALGDVVVRVAHRLDGQVEVAEHALTVVGGNLTAYRPRFGGGYAPQVRIAVPDDVETRDDLGPGIRVNDPGEVDPIAEDDLIELEVSASFPVPMVLERSTTSLRVWTTFDKAPGTELVFQASERTAPLALVGGSATVFVEWRGAGALADLSLVPAGAQGAVDRVRFHAFGTIVMALGGEDQVPTPMVDPNHGTFLVGRALYQLGYDVHHYDEDDVSNTGEGAVHDEIVNALQHRRVTDVVAFGYSHGGGSTHDLCSLLDGSRAMLPSFGIPFTSYVDGVDNGSDVSTAQELRYPPGSAWHANHYQVGQFLPDFFLDGGPVPGSNPPTTGLNVETTPWGANATHFTVDDYTQVLSYIESNLEQRTGR